MTEATEAAAIILRPSIAVVTMTTATSATETSDETATVTGATIAADTEAAIERSCTASSGVNRPLEKRNAVR